MIDLRVFISPQKCTVGEAPAGLFFLEDGGEIICKSEYSKDSKCLCTIVDGGENYCGGDDKEGFPVVIK